MTIAAIAVTAAMSFPAPATAQGFLEFLFGGARHAVRSIDVPIREPLDTLDRVLRGAPETSHGPRGNSAYCVRSCDGRYFPVQSVPGLSAERACKAMCPVAETKIFYGSAGHIDSAVTSGGLRYADLPAAFAYREKLVEGCTCNGRSPLGIVTPDAQQDPTLRPGDIVVTDNGLKAFTGRRTAPFTPVQDFRGFSRQFRDKLDQIEVSSKSADSLSAWLPGDANASATKTAAGAGFEEPSANAAGNQTVVGALLPAELPRQDQMAFNQRWVIESDISPAMLASKVELRRYGRGTH